MSEVSLRFFTYFNSRFLIQGMVAVSSFLKQNKNCAGIIYCQEELIARILIQRFQGERVEVRLLSEISEIEELVREISLDRNPIEVLITLKPFLILESLKRVPKGELLMYIDADLFFYQPVDSLIADLKGESILLTRHIFPVQLSENVRYGIVNAGFVLVRNTGQTIAVVADWARRCREWCFLRLEEGKYGDQLYLNDYLGLPEVKLISDPGVNNGVYYFQQKRKICSSSKEVYVDGSKLICFHFHGIYITKNLIYTGYNRYRLPKRAVRVWIHIYRKYLSEVKVELKNYAASSLFEMTKEDVFAVIPSRRWKQLQRLRKTVVLH